MSQVWLEDPAGTDKLSCQGLGGVVTGPEPSAVLLSAWIQPRWRSTVCVGARWYVVRQSCLVLGRGNARFACLVKLGRSGGEWTAMRYICQSQTCFGVAASLDPARGCRRRSLFLYVRHSFKEYRPGYHPREPFVSPKSVQPHHWASPAPSFQTPSSVLRVHRASGLGIPAGVSMRPS